MSQELDTYGSFTALKGTPTGWFHLEELGGRTWFVTPEGNAFFPVSLAHIYTGNSQETVQKLYNGDQTAWLEDWFATTRRLGFNCALSGVTSQCRDPGRIIDVDQAEALFRRESFPYAVGLFLVPHPNELPEGQERPDIFSAEFREWAEERITHACAKHAEDPMVLGYYYGFGSWIKPRSWIASLGRDVTDENEQDHVREMVVSLYSFARDIVRKHDPNHLIFGPYVKEQSFDLETWKAVAPFVDTLTPQHVNRDISFSEQTSATGRPILVSDESTAHLFNIERPHGLKSPEDKGRIYASVLERHLRDPSVCGVNFCATLYDLNDGPLMERLGMMEGLYDWRGNPKPGLPDAVAEANTRIYERATEPCGAEALAALDARHFGLWDAAHGRT